MPTAILVDDSPLVRAQLRDILTGIGVAIVAEADTGETLPALYARYHPDLITLDIEMPGKDGVTVAIELRREFPAATIVMCSTMTSRDRMIACRRAGVLHYLLKPFDPRRAEQVFRFAIAPDG